MKTLSILGSTGSIGTQAIEVAQENGFRVAGLGAHSNIDLLEMQARQLKPELVCIFHADRARELGKRLAGTGIKIVSGIEGLCALASLDAADIVLNSVVGMVGLRPTLAALEAGKNLALANKETLVTGGELVLRTAWEHGVKILPVDSEHSAIFQCLQGNPEKALNKIILTASGGPFYGKTAEELRNVTVKDALNHPNWSMGAKITVDSATLMNKGLELIEAVWLFGCKAEDVEIVVHRESVVHSAVEYADYSVIAQMGVPNMKLPIQYALTYPERVPCNIKRLSLTDYGTLSFAKPDLNTFVCLQACYEALEKGGLYPALVNGTNEEAVSLFLNGKISFLTIGQFVRDVLAIQLEHNNVTVEGIEAADRLARQYVLARYKEMN
ncbi:MAG: 1-deoxy-D-xylulose-5-phosphate reductoisomerase [Oscillospiraceae bacterium]|jgi:1-deoxy-D-xylulose-5-phosphate reductoisomerase